MRLGVHFEFSQKYAGTDDFGAISQIVNLRVKGEALLATGNTSAAVGIFRELDTLDAPMKSRDHLGRALVALAATQVSLSARQQLDTEAKNAYARIALNPRSFGLTLSRIHRGR